MTDLPPLESLDGEDPDVVAAELALGLLDGDERAVAIRRVLAEPGFAREVERWRARLADLFDLWPPMAAPDIFARIERSIDRPSGPVEMVKAPLAQPGKAWPGKVWPGLAALSSIAAVGLLIILITRPVPVPPQPQPQPAAPVIASAVPTLVASITPSAKGTPVTAVYNDRTSEIRLTEATLADGNRSAQLWIIPAGDTPHSLGLLRSHGGTVLAVRPADRARIAAGAVLAVSLEPIGGSPTGQPTGPVVATGALSQV